MFLSDFEAILQLLEQAKTNTKTSNSFKLATLCQQLYLVKETFINFT